MVIASYSKPEEAHLAASILRGSGIDAYVRDEHTIGMYWLYSTAIGGVKLEVADIDTDHALEVLQLAKQNEDALLLCPDCQSSRVRVRELSLLNALSIAFYLPLPFTCRKVDCMDCGKSFERKH